MPYDETDKDDDQPIGTDSGVVSGTTISSEDDLDEAEVDKLQGRVADDSLDAVKAGGPIELDDGFQTRPLDTLTREEREEHVRTAQQAAKENAEALEKAQADEDRVDVEGGVASDTESDEEDEPVKTEDW